MVKIVLCILAFGSYAGILLGVVKRRERRRLMVVGEMEDNVGDRVFLFIILFAFVGTLLVLGE